MSQLVRDPTAGFHGKVHRCDETYVATRFASWFMPFVPRRSYAVVAEDRTGAPNRVIPIRLSWTSVIAAYARTWGTFGCLVLAAEQWYLGLAMALAMVYPWFFLGRLTADQRAQRRVYALYARFPLDVADAPEWRVRLRQTIDALALDRSRALAHGSYRAAVNLSEDWPRIALDDRTTDVDYLTATLTIARIEWGASTGARRREFGRVHDAIWRRLRALKPALLHSERSLLAASSSTDSSLAKQNRESVSPTAST